MAGLGEHEAPAEPRAGFRARALGVDVEVTLDATVPARARAALVEAWSGAAVAPGEEAPLGASLTAALVEPGRPVPPGGTIPRADLIAPSVASLAAELSTRVTLAAIEARRGALLLLHAAGVADADGRVIAFVGPSGRGKSTLARALSRRLGYVSDETVGIAEDGSVLPYRKPLSLVRDDGNPKDQVPPSALGLRALPGAPLRLASIVLIDRDAGAGPGYRIEPVPLARAIPELVPQVSYLGDLPLPLRTLAGHARATGGILRLAYRDAAELDGVVPAILEAAASGVRGAPEPAPPARPAPSPAPGSPLRRAPVRDALATPDGLLLFHEGTVHLLDGIGPTLWDAAAPGTDRAGLLRAALEAHGAPDAGVSAWVAVTEAAAALAGAGLLLPGPAGEEAGWARSEDCAAVDGGDRVAVLGLADPGAEPPRLLEGTGAEIWRAATAGGTEPGPTTEEVVIELATRYGATESDIRDDVEGFLRELEERGLLVRGPRPGLGTGDGRGRGR